MADLYNLGDRAPSRSQRALQAVRPHVQPGSFPLLFVASLLFYVLNGLANDSMAGTILVLIGRIAVACAGLYVLSAHRVTLWLGVLVVGFLITVQMRLWALDPHVSLVLEDSIIPSVACQAEAAPSAKKRSEYVARWRKKRAEEEIKQVRKLLRAAPRGDRDAVVHAAFPGRSRRSIRLLIRRAQRRQPSGAKKK